MSLSSPRAAGSSEIALLLSVWCWLAVGWAMCPASSPSFYVVVGESPRAGVAATVSFLLFPTG